MATFLRQIAYRLPEKVLSNEQLAADYPHWGVAEAAKRCGVQERRIAAAHETALDLAVSCCEALLAANEGLRERVGAVIFCTQSPDYIMPPNACLLHRALRLPESVMAFDISLACSGFTYALGIARGLLVSGAAEEVLVVTGDTYSRFISPEDRGTRMLFGDGAAVTWLSRTRAGQACEVIDINFATDGKGYDKFIIPAGGCRRPKTGETAQVKVDKSGNKRSPEHIHMDGLAILTFVKTRVPTQIRALCARNQLALDDIDLFVFHQASQLGLDALIQQLQLKPERVFSNLPLIGNTVSSSIPIALQDAIDQGRLHPGNRVLLSGFGVGLSWSSALLQVVGV